MNREPQPEGVWHIADCKMQHSHPSTYFYLLQRQIQSDQKASCVEAEAWTALATETRICVMQIAT